ncbi:hypothetical protein CYLTODRAFT_357747 [Cylindrobasidium torrendii FP15055 ss-10]|uniref:Phosphatidylglycerol lysyltransferase C-terminal domain-containing protein n=1 Tax=Cylindrobasidium torrendii FP15055 ss-10 TaxID=1314674 RepID=A0A0D7B342_9AGAR|nr:hypothetical protein CYLTODRAFT_357747 [Cylindrobasidium torrendii FP15055 ss-10]
MSIAKNTIADLIATYGNSSATAWLEFERYHLWQAEPGQVPESTFAPIQGYMIRNKYIFAWGNPLVSDRRALPATVRAFVTWVRAQALVPVWCCIDEYMEKTVANVGWSTVDCIYEDVMDPAHLLSLTAAATVPPGKGKSGQGVVAKDLKKGLRRAEKAGVYITEVTDMWSNYMREEVHKGVERWRKTRTGPQIASTTFQPFTDEEHRRYWLAWANSEIVGILVLTPTNEHSYLIKGCASFPDAPRGTSEALIHKGLEDIYRESLKSGVPIPVSFGITASDGIRPISNLSGWKVTSMSKVYHSVSSATGLFRRADFRSKFDSERQPSYVAYTEGFGLDAIRCLLNLLKK